MKLKNKKVFVSGGAGVIGRELVSLLIKEGATVWVGDLKKRPDSFPGSVIYRQGDLNTLTRNEVEKFSPEIVFHLAATFERSEESYGFWKENYEHNLKLSHHLMSMLKDEKSLKSVVFASSYLIYDSSLYLKETPWLKPCRLSEGTAVSPRNLTGAAKLMHEVELKFLETFFGEHCRFIMARIFRGYGKGSRDIISRWVRDLLSHKPIYLYGKEGQFDYIYAKDSAEGLMRLALCEEASGVYNLGTGQSRKVSEVADLLKKFFPEAVVVEKEDKILYEASEADMTKTKAVLNWSPSIKLEESIPSIITYEQKQMERSLERDQLPSGILITSLSKKVPLIKALRKAAGKCFNAYVLWGADSDAHCIGRNFVDCFWEMPLLENLTIEDLINFCQSHGIRYIIPTRDAELVYFSKHKQLLEEHEVFVMVSSPKSVHLCLDKWALYENLVSKEVLVPDTMLNLDDGSWGFYVVKERFGAGSQSLSVKVDRETAKQKANALRAPLFQQYIQGKEFSADVYVDCQGKTKGVVLRSRDYVVGGESQMTTTFSDESLEQKVSDLVESLGLYGHLVVQGIIQEDEKVFFIEVNARFGGASTLSLCAGLDSFYWFFIESMGGDIKEIPFIREAQPQRLLRYPKDSISTISESLQCSTVLQN